MLTEIGLLHELHSVFSFPAFCIMDIMSCFHDAGVSPPLRTWLKHFKSIGVKLFLNILYHSAGSPSPPGTYVFNLDMALSISALVISCVMSLLTVPLN